MVVLELAFVVVVSMMTGYHAGKAGQRAEAVETGKVCFDEAYNDRKKGCYQVIDTTKQAENTTTEVY